MAPQAIIVQGGILAVIRSAVELDMTPVVMTVFVSNQVTFESGTFMTFFTTKWTRMRPLVTTAKY